MAKNRDNKASIAPVKEKSKAQSACSDGRKIQVGNAEKSRILFVNDSQKQANFIRSRFLGRLRWRPPGMCWVLPEKMVGQGANPLQQVFQLVEKVFSTSWSKFFCTFQVQKNL